MEPVTPLRRLGERVATLQDRQLSRIQVEGAKSRLLADIARPRSEPVRRLAALGLVAAALLAAVLVGLRPLPLTFDVGPPYATRRVGEWIAAPADSDASVRFSDGTVLTLGPSSRARVVATDPDGARILLEHGRMDADVVPRKKGRWQLDVGPFEVHVTGTRFGVRWDGAADQFTVELYEGSVMVQGPLLSSGQAVVAGQRLEVETRRARFELGAAHGEDLGPREAMERAEPVPEAPAATAEAIAPGLGASVSMAGSRPAPPRSDAPSWRELAQRGDYKGALREAERAGFDEITETATASDLMALADVARFGGDSGRAARALSALRRRFPTNQQAAIAGFMLGRLAFDQRGAYAESARWFDTYLAEQPQGPFAREAAGRLLEAHERAGNLEAARAAARRYLDAYPSGPHAAKATSLIGP